MKVPRKILSPLRMLCLATLLLLLGACGGGGSSGSSPSGGVPPGSGTGSLTVNVGSIPSGATVTVLGPGNFDQSFSQSTTLTNLAAGTYTVGASVVADGSGNGSLEVPAITGNPAKVTAGGTATASVSYAALAVSWQSVGPRSIAIYNGIPAAGKLDALAVDLTSPLVPAPNSACTGAQCGTAVELHSTMFVGGGSYNGPGTYAGIYTTTDGGQTWTQANNGLGNVSVNALWIDPTTSCAGGCTLVAATGSNADVPQKDWGLYQSTDSGQSWKLTGPYGDSTALLEVGTTLYAGTGMGIYSSTDGGATWTQVEQTSVPVRSLGSATTSTAGTYLYAGLDNGDVLVESSTSGPWLTYTPDATHTGIPVTSLAVNPTNPQNAYAVDAGYYNTPDLWVTANAGASWAPITPQNSYGGSVSAAEVAFDPQARALYIGNDVYFGACASPSAATCNAGGNFAQRMPPSASSAGAWWDNRGIHTGVGGAALNNANDVMIVADQGLYLTPDEGYTWYSLNGNLTSSIVYTVAVKGSTIITTMQDLGPLGSFDGGATWDSHQSSNPPGSEGGTAVINPGNPSYTYVYTGWGFQTSTDGGMNYAYSPTLNNNGFPGCGGNSQTLAVDAQNPAVVYAAAYDCQQTSQGFSQGIYESTDYGQTWSKLGWPITAPVMVAVDPTNDKNIFVGQTNGALEMSHDGGKSWNAEPIGQVQGNTWWPVTLAVNPSSPNIVLVGLSGPPSAGGGVLRSTDGGNTFVQANQGLDATGAQPWPDSIFRLGYDPAGSGAVVAARFSGIYLSGDNGASWTSLEGNIVPNFASSIAWDSGHLYVSTFGEGVLRLSGPF